LRQARRRRLSREQKALQLRVAELARGGIELAVLFVAERLAVEERAQRQERHVERRARRTAAHQLGAQARRRHAVEGKQRLAQERPPHRRRRKRRQPPRQRNRIHGLIVAGK
jgi:hypothetical protein